jgi:hypothetical protein
MTTSGSSVLLLATLAATALATDGGLDAQSLVQIEVGRHRQPSSSTDACTCMHWRDVYANHGISCGQGQELAGFGGMQAYSFVGQEFCVNFYTQVSGNFCTNREFGKETRDQWCYVSSACQQLGGGSAVSDTISWKMCQDGVDTTLRSMQPEAVLALGIQENKDNGLLMKMAYPIHDDADGLIWPDIKAQLTGGAPPNPQVAALANSTLRSVQASGQPLIFDSSDHHPSFGVVFGSRTFESHFTPWFFQNMGRPGFESNMGRMNTYTCITGCEN